MFCLNAIILELDRKFRIAVSGLKRQVAGVQRIEQLLADKLRNISRPRGADVLAEIRVALRLL